MLCHLYLVSLSSLLGNLSFSLMPQIHLTILISALTVSQNDNTNRTKAVKSNIVYKVVTANNTHTQYYWSYSYLLQNVIIRQSAYKFYSTLLETMRLSCRPTVLEIERAICRKSPILTYPTCIWRPRWNFAFIRKLESLGLSCGVVCVILCLAVLTQYRLVTHDDNIYCASIALHGKNDNKNFWLEESRVGRAVSYTHLTLPTTPYV